MNEQLNQELETIKADIKEYVNAPFVRGPEGVEANQAVKSKLKTFIIKIKEDGTLTSEEKQALTTKAIIVLAENTGSHVDKPIASGILKELQERKYLSDEDINTFNDHTRTRRWE